MLGSVDYQELLGVDEDDYQAPAEIINLPQARGATPRSSIGNNSIQENL